VGDLHLLETATGAIDQGVDTGLSDDFDGNLRDAAPDVGADEWVDLNTPPVVAISSPIEPAVFDESTWIDFAATGDDIEDGDLTSSLIWTSSLEGQFGTGGDISVRLMPGLHLVKAEVADSGGLEAWDEVEVGVTSQGCPEHIVVSGETVTGQQVDRAVFSITVGPDVTIQPTGELTLLAGQKVILGNGFAVYDGGILTAISSQDPCN
jgi:hypothetical protein